MWKLEGWEEKYNFLHKTIATVCIFDCLALRSLSSSGSVFVWEEIRTVQNVYMLIGWNLIWLGLREERS
jgi:hypothetical protein